MSVYNEDLLNDNKSIDHDNKEDDDKFYHTSLASAAVDEGTQL